jgi:hypothetical protein
VLLHCGAQLVNEILFHLLELPTLFLDLSQPLQHLIDGL